MTLNIGTITIDCRDVQGLAEFWSRALEMQVIDDDGRSVLLGREDSAVRVSLQKVPERRVGKNRVHLDLNGEPRHAAAERMVELGAIIQEEINTPRRSWIVLTDPEGNEFCIDEHMI